LPAGKTSLPDPGIVISKSSAQSQIQFGDLQTSANTYVDFFEQLGWAAPPLDCSKQWHHPTFEAISDR
jgi:hypothetical protein